MPGTHDLALFIVSGLLLNLTPGADLLYITSRSAAHGLRAGAAAVLGVSAGCAVHVLGAALGVSALLAASATAFTVLKLLGAAYLVYMGVMLLRHRPAQQRVVADVTNVADAADGAEGAEAGGAGRPPSLRAIAAQGFLTNVLNPKVALFFIAFVPPFIDPAAANKPLAFLMLGAIFTLNSTLCCLLLAWLAARLGAAGVGSRAGTWIRRTAGGLFVLLGLRLALAERG
jgi:threonine/homoserine/homoserine lactone efflux protein